MLLDPIRIRRPDLRAEVQQIVHLLCDQPEGQHLSIAELIRILGINVAPWLHSDLVGRGDLHLGRERFENTGTAIQRKVRLLGFSVDLTIAGQLSGRITRFQDSFHLSFEPDHSVGVHKFLFHIELRRLDVNSERIYVDFSGAQDLFIDLKDLQAMSGSP